MLLLLLAQYFLHVAKYLHDLLLEEVCTYRYHVGLQLYIVGIRYYS